MEYQCFVRYFFYVVQIARQRFNAALAGCGKHLAERLLKAGLNARFVAQLCQLVSHQTTVVGETNPSFFSYFPPRAHSPKLRQAPVLA